jgi:hypothetical protein
MPLLGAAAVYCGHFRPALDYLVGGGQQRFRDSEAEGLGGLEVDDEIELGGLVSPRPLRNAPP